MSTDKNAGMNSGHFVIAVTAVGANLNGTPQDPAGTDTYGRLLRGTKWTIRIPKPVVRVNILFPGFLADDMDGTDNIDACGTIVTAAVDSNRGG